MKATSDMRASLSKGYHLLTRGIGRLRPNGSAPPNAATWDAQYAVGRWSYLASLPELSRYSILVGYAAHLKPRGALLDVGCGEGVLYQRLLPHGCERYVGVDLSVNAIVRSGVPSSSQSKFVATNGEDYEPDESFDVIVFNEVLYFFNDPIGALHRYARSLRKDGIFLVSTCTGFRGSGALLRRLKREFSVIDETRVTHGENDWSWICTVLSTTRET